MRVATEQEISEALRSLADRTPRLVVGGNWVTPRRLVELAEANLEALRFFVLNAQGDWPDREGIVLESPFLGAGARRHRHVDYLPMRLSLVPRLFRAIRPPDAVLVQVTPPVNGEVSLGVEVNILPAAIEAVRRRGGLVLAEINPKLPRTVGDSVFPAEWVDLAIEVDRPIDSPATEAPDALAHAIGEQVARFGVDGATVQFGIGQIPDAAAAHLADRANLRIWTELASDGVLGLQRAGALDPSVPIRTSFLFGSPELYEWADANPRLELLRTETINDPSRIATHHAMLSINTALQVDLFAQANASALGGHTYSGFGGQPDFVVGALHSDGGHSVIALRSFHEPTASSNVVPLLGERVTSFQHSAIVSEHGCAEIFGLSTAAQHEALIEKVADPRARAALWAAAAERGITPTSTVPGAR